MWTHQYVGGRVRAYIGEKKQSMGGIMDGGEVGWGNMVGVEVREMNDIKDLSPSQDFQALAEYLWHGRIHNRWFDKCINVIVCEGGAVGANIEHSMLDALVRKWCVIYCTPHYHNHS